MENLVDKYNPEIIIQYIRTGKSNSLPADMQKYLDLLELARSLYDKYDSRSEIVGLLMTPTYGLSRNQANKIFVDALNLFYSDNDIKVEVWANIAHKQANDVYQLALAKNDLETARKCIADMAKYKGFGKEQKEPLPIELLSKRIVVYTFNPEDVGIEKADRNELARLIDGLDNFTEYQKSKLKKDALIEKPDFIQDLNPGDYEENKG